LKSILLLILFPPLLGALFHMLLGRHCSRRTVEVVACGSVVTSFVMALAGLLNAGQQSFTIVFFQWFAVEDLTAAVSFLYDPLSAIMAVMVTFVSTIIHVYSAAYMREDTDYVRYFCYLNLFVFSMLAITLADNLVFLFLGWEGVGFCSYALIGFWYGDIANATAGRKAFILTRIGDVAFGIGLGLFYVLFKSLSLAHITANAATLAPEMATVLGLLLLWSAVGKSAQLPLAVWLPDAMAGPTPVSALIHAATMVTAGVYLLIRLFPIILLSPTALVAITLVGAVTALFASCSALGQTDIKRVLAYSTISQVGYMFLAVGAGDIIGSMSYLLSHAFFKSLLFLAAGCIIQALHEEHDIHLMGARVRRHLPVVYWVFLAGALSLGALPPSGGFLNKDRVLLAMFTHPGEIYRVLWGVTMVTSFLTTLYTFRLFFLVFTGDRGDSTSAPLKSIPRLMVWVLWPLALLSLFAGFSNLPPVWSGKELLAHYLGTVPGSIPHPEATPRLEWIIAASDGSLAVIALASAYFLYGPKGALIRLHPGEGGNTLQMILFNGFYLDWLYRKIVADPYRSLARFLWIKVDESTVDAGMVGYGKAFDTLSAGLRVGTTGRLSTYLRMLLLGFTAIIGTLAIGLYGGW
jgi:NADH-quinone oxidoreductase subunit L